MTETLDDRILNLLNDTEFLTLCTGVGGNPSGANVYFANDGFDLYFFTFNPSRKAEQIRANPSVQCVVRPEGLPGIRELQIDGLAKRLSDPDEVAKARRMILAVTDAFKAFMDDEFLTENNVVGYYRIKPTVIKYVDFYADPQFEWREFPENRQPVPTAIFDSTLRTILLYVRAVRAPFFTATLAPILVGAAVAYYQFGRLHWPVFWWSLLGALLAHAGTNVVNDYGDHLTRNDEVNRFFSPFNGGSRMIQAGLMSPAKMLVIACLCFAGAIWIGLHLNGLLHGAYLASSPLLWAGVAGIALGVFYSAGPIRLSYHGWGDIAVMLGFGPVIILGAHYVQNQALVPEVSWDPVPALLVSVPVALLVGLILFINGFQDYEADRRVGKRTWIVRTAEGGEVANYRKPFAIYTAVLVFTFAYIALLGVAGLIDASISTPWVWLALLPGAIAYKAIRKGKQWLDRWDSSVADPRKLPYELLPVNALTILIHLTAGLLLALAFVMGRVLG